MQRIRVCVLGLGPEADEIYKFRVARLEQLFQDALGTITRVFFSFSDLIHKNGLTEVCYTSILSFFF